MIKLMYITNETEVASLAQRAGVDRIFIDLEILGKAERQKSIRSFITHHSIADIPAVRRVLTQTELLVRVNPIHSGSKEEINAVLETKPDLLMLPMFTTANEVRTFVELVGQRAQISLLLETADAVEAIDEILELEGIDEIHIGLNDLHLTLGQSFLFEPISTGMLESLSKKIRSKGIRFGFGGIGRMGEGLIPAEMLLTEHYRIQSEMVILSRAFREDLTAADLKAGDWLKSQIDNIRAREALLANYSKEQFHENFTKLSKMIRDVADAKNA